MFLSKRKILTNTRLKVQSTHNYVEEEGIKIGLTIKQINTLNFGFHTTKAIQTIQKRNPSITLNEAFEMVKSKSHKDIGIFVKNYLLNTRKKQLSLNEMSLIRVLVNTGRGFGHQRAAITLMCKLREIGFNGIFDIQCDDRLGAQLMDSQTGKSYKNEKPLVSSKLISMISDFNSVNLDENGIRQIAGLGAVKISSLPSNYENIVLNLPEADLAVCAADDGCSVGEKKQNKILRAPLYIGLEPTDWYQGSCFVIDSDNIDITLPSAKEMRLSSNTASKLLNLASVTLSTVEEKVLKIVRTSSINTQLVYGLYPEKILSIETNKLKLSGNLDQATEMQLIIEANMQPNKTTNKPVIILLPQQIALDIYFIKELKKDNTKVHFIDLTKEDFRLEKYTQRDIIIAYTGHLQQPFFDYLILQGTTLPPVIEGCNAREICESFGKPFIHGSAKHDRLKEYDGISLIDKQQLHIQASLCVEQGKKENVVYLKQYMEEALNSNAYLYVYHKQRKKAFLSMPDACEVALDTLGINYKRNLEKDSQPTRKKLRHA